ncbi:MAG: hypothetical protein WD066_09700 [Planctomycetaceae bacterium]
MHSFACPHCSAPLRIRDRSLFERPIDCPDCGVPFRVEPDGRNGIRIVPEEADGTAAPNGATAANDAIHSTIHTKTGRPRNRQRQRADRSVTTARRPSRSFLPAAGALLRLRQAVLTPVGISWLAAGTAGLGLLFAIRPWSRDEPPASGIPPAAQVTAAAVESPPSKASTDGPAVAGETELLFESGLPANAARLPDAPPGSAEPPREIADPPPIVPPAPLPAAPEPPAIVANDPPAEPRPPAVADELEPIAPHEPPQTIDVVQALSQPIRKFDQSRAVPVRDLLKLVEEMTAVPIRFDRGDPRPEKATLDRPISLVLERTTAGGILDAVVAQAGLAYDIHADGIDVRSASPPVGSRQ